MSEAVIRLDGWAGRHDVSCEVVGETPKRYRVRMLEDANLPRRYVRRGEVVLVPKHAVRIPDERRASRGKGEVKYG